MEPKDTDILNLICLTIPTGQYRSLPMSTFCVKNSLAGSDGDRQRCAADTCSTFYFDANIDPALALKLGKLKTEKYKCTLQVGCS
jgi:hypothetical protein